MSELDNLFNEVFFEGLLKLTDEPAFQARTSMRDQMNSDISAMWNALCIMQNDSERATAHAQLGDLLVRRYRQFGGEEFLNSAISCYNVALASAEESDVPRFVKLADAMGDALLRRFILATNDIEVAEAISWYERALEMRKRANLDEWSSLYGLGASNYWRAMHYASPRRDECEKSSISMLRSASYLREALSKEGCLTRTALASVAWYHTMGQLTPQDFEPACEEIASACCDNDVDSLISAALALSNFPRRNDQVYFLKLNNYMLRIFSTLLPYAHATGHPAEALLAHALGHLEREEWQSESVQLSIPPKVLDRFRLALRILPSAHVQRRQILQHLCTLLKEEFRFSGSIASLNEAILLLRNWLKSDESAAKSRPMLNNLSNCLRERYRISQRAEDLTDALDLLLHCTSAFPEPINGTLPYFLNLQDCYINLSGHEGGSITRLDQAIDIGDRCRANIPDQACKALNFGGIAEPSMEALMQRYQLTNDPMDLEQAVIIGSQAIKLHTANTSGLGMIFDATSRAYCALGEHHKRESDIIFAIEKHEACLEMTAPVDSSERHSYLAGLAADRVALARLTEASEDVARAMADYAAAASYLPGIMYERLDCTLKWIDAAEYFGDHDSLFRAFDGALQLLPRVIYLGSELKPRMDALKRAPGLACRAALHALRQHEPMTALEWLEKGRGIFWNRALQPRESFDSLPKDIVDRLRAISHSLDQQSKSDEMILRGRQLTEEFDALLENVSRRSGYEHLFSAQSFDALRQAAKDGPVVVVLGDDLGGFAIIIASPISPVQSLALERLSGDTLVKLVDTLRKASVEARGQVSCEMAESTDRRMQKISRRSGTHDQVFYQLLAEIWIAVGDPIVQALHLPACPDADDRPRLWLCSVGHFAFLPLHAAGVYTGPSPTSFSDYCVISYTPSLQSLLSARRSPAPILPRTGRLLLIAEPEAPGYSPLPHTLNEVAAIAQAASSSVEVSSLVGQTCVEDVVKKLSETSIAHFACHGQQNKEEPLQSGFALKDGRLTVSQLMEIRMEKASLAVLSACDSAAVSTALPDEAIHLAAAMSFIGFRSVIGTLWNMNDADGPTVMEHIYTALFYPDRAATYELVPRALDAAVRQLRSSGVPPNRWATYVHIGI